MAAAVENVFAFDQYDQQMRDHLRTVLQRHGIPIGEQRFTVELAAEAPLPPPAAQPEVWRGEAARHGATATHAALSVKGSWAWRRDHMQELRGRTQGRVQRFDEQLYAWNLPNTSRPKCTPATARLLLCVA